MTESLLGEAVGAGSGHEEVRMNFTDEQWNDILKALKIAKGYSKEQAEAWNKEAKESRDVQAMLNEATDAIAKVKRAFRLGKKTMDSYKERRDRNVRNQIEQYRANAKRYRALQHAIREHLYRAWQKSQEKLP